MTNKVRHFDDQPSFWGHEQASQILSVRDLRQARHPHHPWRCRTAGEARPQRSVRLRIRTQISNAAACEAAASTAQIATTTFRDW